MRTPLTIFALGLGACLALGLMMQHLLRVSQERNPAPVLVEVNRIFGPRLDCDARMKTARRPDGKVVELTIRPLLTGVARDLAREIGGFVWRSNQDPELSGVEILCEDPLGALGERILIERPSSLRTPAHTGPGSAGRATEAPTPPAGGAARPAEPTPAPAETAPAAPKR
ncbi:MAG: hypothetical protein R3F56_08690 [Planctomycetota bacterium]